MILAKGSLGALVFGIPFFLVSCASPPSGEMGGAPALEESDAMKSAPGTKWSVPQIPENSEHGYLLADNRIPTLDSCEEWVKFWEGSGPAVSFAVAAGFPDIEQLEVSTQIFLKNRHLDADGNGVLCFEGPPSASVMEESGLAEISLEGLSGYELVVADIRRYRQSSEPLTFPNLIQVYEDPSVDELIRDHYTRMVVRAAEFWAQFGDSPSLVGSVNVFGHDSRDLYRQRQIAIGRGDLSLDAWTRAEGTGGGTVHTDASGKSHAFFRLNDRGGDFPYDDYAFHEITHSYQEAFAFHGNYENTPCWFGEGYAKAVGHANTSVDDNENLRIYRGLRSSDAARLRIYFAAEGEDLKTQIVNTLQFSHNHPQCNTEEPLFGYRLGWLTAEAWIEEFGFAATVDFMKTVAGRDFEATFESYFGVPMDSWLSTSAADYIVEVLDP